MRLRPSFLIGLCLLLLAGAWFFWPAGNRPAKQDSAVAQADATKINSASVPDQTTTRSASTAPQLFTAGNDSTNAVSAVAKTNPFPYRLTNTKKSINDLLNDRKAILLENAVIDTGAKLDLGIPKNLQASGDPGAYIVQARGPVDAAFRAQLAAAGAEIVSYIPNNAYLVRVTAGGAQQLAALTQAVIPYEPYYKLTPSLLAALEKNQPVGELKVAAYANAGDAAAAVLEKAGMTIATRESSPFGPVFTLQNVTDVAAVARMSVLQRVEPLHQRTHANDLSRETTGVAADSITTTNYLNLDGKNVLVEVNDSGIDATHPDLAGRVFGTPITDTDGHGTFVAGIIAGDGTESTTVTNAQGSINPGTNFQYRGKAPKANLYSQPWNRSDQTMQEAAALTNALISNNSWNYGGDNAYDLAAASYDAAVRDALTAVTGSQPVLFVFSSGNVGGGNSDGGGGNPDTILSPATAKNVITVGALEQFRNITNIVTDRSSNSSAVWQPQTDQSSQVAGFSSRGNVGVGVEGANGRYKPDVVAPGTFVVSTRSQQWDEAAYYNPTNYEFNTFVNQTITNGGLNQYSLTVPENAVAVMISLVTNRFSTLPFPTNLPIYVEYADRPPNPPTLPPVDFMRLGGVSIPPDSGGVITGISSIQNNFFYFAVGSTNSSLVHYDLITTIVTTNDLGDYFLVLSNLNVSLSGGAAPYYYRYESGTSMAAADVSGVLALMQDFFINSLHTTPSPGLLKAMLINGARVTGNYSFNPANTVNPEGWGAISLPNSLPLSITNLITNPGGGTSNSIFFLDQSVTNALATGDRQTFLVTVDTNTSASLPLRVTLAWTDPAGNPAAAIKLVNNLDLVVTNLDTGDVFFGNDIPASSVFNAPWATNGPPNLDFVNNIENVFLAPQLSGNYSVTVIGRGVNVNAVTAQTNNPAGVYGPNVVQDYSLVISCGDSFDGGAITVAASPVISNPTASQLVTFVIATNTPLLDQFVGANTPLMGTNTIGVGTNTMWGTNGAITLGMTNQWHFFVVTNVLGFQYAAFITFLPATLSIPRTGVYADSTDNATQPEADIDLYVADPHKIGNAYNLTNLDPIVISSSDKSLTRGGVEFVTYSNSALSDVYYIGVKSEAQEGSEFGFMAVFSETPFSQTDANGNEYVQGVPLPVNIPDATPTHPGKAYIFAIATTPIEVERVVVTNTIVHENFGDLIGTLSHNGASTVLNNHASLANPPGLYTKIYDDSGRGDHPGSQLSDGPGSLQSFQGQEGVGPWILTEVDGATNHIGAVTGLTLFIEKHRKLTEGIQVAIPPGTWFYTFLDVPPGYTNLSISATNLDSPLIVPPLQLYLDYNVQPDFSNYLDFVELTNCATGFYPTGTLPGNTISYGPPLRPGTYYVGLFNPNLTRTANAYLIARLSGLAAPTPPTPATTNGPSLLDDAVSSTTVFVGSTQQVATVNVGVVVNHPRMSDLTFTLLSPSGQRVLLMENRGGSSTNAGDMFLTTNNFAPVTANGGGLPQTNYLNVGQTSGSLTVSWDFFTVPDEMTVYYGTNGPFTPPNVLFDSGLVPNTGTTNITFGPGTFTDLTIIMNQYTNPAGAGGTRWTYTAGGIQTNYNYLMFTDDTNLTTIPIKFAIPPFDFTAVGTNYTLSDFDLATNGDYLAPTNIYDAHGGWNLTNITSMLVGTNLVMLTNNVNMVSVVTDPANAAGGTNFLALASGSMFRQIPMTPGRLFSLSFLYRGPGISGWWRGEGDATDSSDPENLGNNGQLIGRFSFPAGEVGQAFSMEFAGSEFQFAGTNTYVQIRQVPFPISVSSATESNAPSTVLSSALDVGTGSGFTVEGWINPTNVSFQQPLVEWLARSPTNLVGTNVVILAGPFLNPATSHYYYLLGNTNWTTSEFWATELGGHLVTIDTANEQNWVYDTFASYGGTNRNLWIGLTNNAPANPTNYVWSSGLTNTGYFNWQTNQPNFCTGNEHYTAMLGATNALPGLWFAADNNGKSCTFPPTNKMFGVVEVPELLPNGVQFWISVTNAPGTTNFVTSTNGCLFANLIDVTNGSHYIFSAAELVQTNVYQHVALTYNTNSGIASLYYNGTNVASTNLGYFLPKTTGDVLLGKDMSRATNNYFGGKMDEMSIYGRSLSGAEILAIYNVSFLTTNRNIGKFDPSITPALGLAEAQVSFGLFTNMLLGLNNAWQSQHYSFTVTSNSLPLQVSGLEPGMLLDSFNISEQPLGNLYYFPEDPLSVLKGQNAFGTWTLQILDNRTGAYLTNVNELVSWQLQIVLQDNTLPAVALGSEEATTISVPPGEIVDLTVAVPTWARAATNVLVSSTLPVDLLFNQTNAPTGNVPPDYLFLTASTSGSYTMTTAPVPPPQLLPGQTYHLGVRNPGTHSATVVIRVDFDIAELTNGVPVTDVLTTNAVDTERYYVFNVSSNAYEATFQLLNMNGNADLVVRKGPPLPTLVSSDYGSFNTTNADEAIYVLTNSSPVPLSAGQWYLGVFKRDAGPVHYTVLAKELLNATPPTIIDLTNGVPFDFTAGPGAALTNFFRFIVTNSPPSIHFQLYNQSGNGDLTVQTNALPLVPPFFQSSQQPGNLPELIAIYTNSAQTNFNNTALTNLALDWYLGVPNHGTNLISYTIMAVIDTNSVFPAFPGAEGAGAGSLGGGSLPGRNGGITNTVYHVTQLVDGGTGSLRDAVSSTNRTIVFDVSGTINLASPLIITNSYLTIAGQTAPGGGITVAGWETSVTNAHDVIIRYVRFRPGGTAASSSVVWANSFETGSGNANFIAGDNFAQGWHVDTGDIDVLNIPYGSTAYQGSYYIDLNGWNSGKISTNVTTVPGISYTLAFAYAKNPSGAAPQAQVLINGNLQLTVTASQANDWTHLMWQATSVVFTATSPSTLLSFASLEPGPNGVMLDAVSLTTNAAISAGSANALRFVNTSNVIADHVSASWSLQHVTAALASANLTVQWSMIADSLYSTTTTNGGSLLRFGNGALSFHHNLYANNYSASPHLADGLSLDFVNNIIYGWGTNAGFTLNEGLTNRMNYVCNYLIANSNSFAPTIAFRGGTTNTWIFQTNNFIDSNTNYILDGANTSWAMFTNQFTQIEQPFPLPPVSTDEAYKAYERVLDFAGLSLMARDSVDTNTVTGVRNQTGTFISSSGALPAIVSTLPPVDSDRDGIPDYWEITFGQFPTNASDFLPSTFAIGYTDLEEYINWLGAPHALTLTNTPVSVDLLKLFGNTGNLSFEVTNSIHGLVYLTNVLVGATGSVTNTGPFSNSIAVFTPTNGSPGLTNYYGYAAFDVTVTNNATVAYFGPVTVSIVVSAVPVVYGAINTNSPVFSTSPTNQTINESTTLTVTNTATDADTNQTLSYIVTMSIDTNAMIANGWPLTYATTIPSPVISTNGIITWTPTELQGPGVYIITTVVTDSGIPPLSATNSFSVTVNEFNIAPVLPAQTNYNISALTTLIVTNTATDADLPPNPLTYTLSVSPSVTNAVISTNGIITWTPDAAQLGLFTFTTIVTDTNPPAVNATSLTATNIFTVFVSAVAGPFVFTQPAQAVFGNSAQLNGMATPNGLPTTAWFEWGTTTNYGSLTPLVSVGAGYNVVYTTNQISGLLTNVPYHFRLVASNAMGTVTGFDQILDEANVVVWGANYVGQGNVPVGLSNVVAIAGAYDHSLALKIDGAVAAWGDNTFGQSTVPPGLNNVLAVAGGQYYSMALNSSGTVTAWGVNILGAISVPVGLNNVVAIAGGTYSSLALQNNGSIVAWGAPFFGLTNAQPAANNSVAVAGGGFHNLAIKNNGTVFAWGDNSAGQLNVPAGLTNVVAIAAGNYHSLALRKDGTVVAWGDNSAGQTNVPPGLNNIVAIAAGGFHSLALRNDGSVVAWGDPSAGQTTVPGGLGGVVAIAGGNLHSMALTPLFNVNPTNPIVVTLTNGLAVTNTIFAGGVDYYRVNVPTDADFTTNSLLFALNGQLNVWFSTNAPPSLTTLLLAGITNGVSILNTTSAPPRIVPGATYYLGVQNTNSFTVTYGIEVDFHLLNSTNVPPFTNSVPITSIIYTNIAGTNGFLLTWFAPSNALFQVQWTTSLVPASWQTFANPPFISYNTNAFSNPTNTQFNFFDDDSQTGGFGPTRFYRLILYGSVSLPNTAPVLPTQVPRTVNPLATLTVTNTATDAQSPPQTLTYTLVNPPAGAGIDTNGIITWTPSIGQADMTNTLTTIVTDNGTPNLSATNTFAVIVTPIPNISSIIFTNGGFLLTWFAPTNEIFQVQFTDSLAPQNWQTFSNIITYTGPVTPANGQFTFFDDGSQYPFVGLRFYRLILYGSVSLPNTAPVLPAQVPRTVNPLATLTVTNTATDAQSPPQMLTYTLTSSVVGTNAPTINTNTGVITWTPALSQAGTSNTITTIVTDNGTPNLSATNLFAVIVNPVPDISNVIYTNGNFLLTWLAPTNDIFTVQVATNLASPVWQALATNITYTGPVTDTNGWFSYLDNGTAVPFGPVRFYRLILTGVTTSSSPVPAPIVISSIVATNGNFRLTWFAPATNQFKVQWTTNIIPPVTWTQFPGTNISATGTFTFLDTNAPMLMKFYELFLLP